MKLGGENVCSMHAGRGGWTGARFLASAEPTHSLDIVDFCFSVCV